MLIRIAFTLGSLRIILTLLTAYLLQITGLRLIGGILLWSFFSTVVLHTRPIRKYWKHEHK